MRKISKPRQVRNRNDILIGAVFALASGLVWSGAAWYYCHYSAPVPPQVPIHAPINVPTHIQLLAPIHIQIPIQIQVPGHVKMPVHIRVPAYASTMNSCAPDLAEFHLRYPVDYMELNYYPELGEKAARIRIMTGEHGFVLKQAILHDACNELIRIRREISGLYTVANAIRTEFEVKTDCGLVAQVHFNAAVHSLFLNFPELRVQEAQVLQDIVDLRVLDKKLRPFAREFVYNPSVHPTIFNPELTDEKST